MNELVPLGFFREFQSSHSTDESIRDFVAAEPSPHREILLRYLRNAEELGLAMELQSDLIDGSYQPSAASPRTDGHWVWRGDLAHYVERHNLRLPDEFVDVVVARGGKPPEISREEHRRIAIAWYGLDVTKL